MIYIARPICIKMMGVVVMMFEWYDGDDDGIIVYVRNQWMK